MIWMLLCKLGRHEWQPVFQHRTDADGVLRSLVRCYRITYRGWVCGAERQQVSSGNWKRGGQL